MSSEVNQNHATRIFLLEDDPLYAKLVEETLISDEHHSFTITHTDTLKSAVEFLCDGAYNIILLDLDLPDSHGLETLAKIKETISNTPIVVLTGDADESEALKALKAGAQDFLVKGSIDRDRLVRAISYALERTKLKQQLEALSLADDLTGLYNRRGFVTLAEQQLKVSARIKKKIFLAYIDINEFKNINDLHGHSEGDRVLMDLAGIIKMSVREYDIVARIGGDEFVALVIETCDEAKDIVRTRIQEKLKELNSSRDKTYNISVSIGVAEFDPMAQCTLAELLDRADNLMYEDKGSK